MVDEIYARLSAVVWTYKEFELFHRQGINKQLVTTFYKHKTLFYVARPSQKKLALHPAT